MKKISIIIPIYNSEKCIEKCIESILNQKYNEFELLLINDGSTDDSLKVIKKYEKNKKVRIFNNENHGVSYSRNYGIKKATGDYIMFIDNDDYIDEDYLSTHVQLIEENNADIVISGYRRITENNKILHQEKLKNTYWSRFIIVAPWAKIYRKDFLVDNNIEFLKCGIGEDVYFNLVAYSYNPKICISNYIGYNWFFNTKSVSNTNQKGLNKNTDILFLLEKILDKYSTIDSYLSYYLIRYYIWYLLFSGRKSDSNTFIEEYNRIKKWYKENKIELKISPLSNKIDGESIKNRMIVLCFITLEKLHLIKGFSKIYCKGEK